MYGPGIRAVVTTPVGEKAGRYVLKGMIFLLGLIGLGNPWRGGKNWLKKGFGNLIGRRVKLGVIDKDIKIEGVVEKIEKDFLVVKGENTVFIKMERIDLIETGDKNV